MLGLEAQRHQLITERGVFGLVLPDDQSDVLLSFATVMLKENQVQNLTRITEPAAVVTRHLVDSLALLQWHRPAPQDKILDLGTGGGFPGFPLALILPENPVVLVDSERKKVDFLIRAAARVGATNVTALHLRAEEAGQNLDLRESQELVTARSVASLPVLLEYALPLVKPGGFFVAYKGAEIEDELATAHTALCLLGGRLHVVHPYKLSSGETHRLIFIEKCNPTPTKYPRNPGIPKKRPLV